MHDKNIFYILISVLLISTVWWVWADLWRSGKKIRQKERELARLEKKFEELSEVEMSYSVIKERFDSYLTDFDSLKKEIPDRDSFVSVFEQIRRVAEKQNIQIESFSPVLEDSYPAIKHYLKLTKKHIERYPVQLLILGDYLTIGAFLEELLTIPAIVNIGKIDIETELEIGGYLSCELVLYTYMFLDEVKRST